MSFTVSDFSLSNNKVMLLFPCHRNIWFGARLSRGLYLHPIHPSRAQCGIGKVERQTTFRILFSDHAETFIRPDKKTRHIVGRFGFLIPHCALEGVKPSGGFRRERSYGMVLSSVCLSVRPSRFKRVSCQVEHYLY